MFTFQNGFGIATDVLPGHTNTFFENEQSTGVVLKYNQQQTCRVSSSTSNNSATDKDKDKDITFHDPLSFAIATKTINKANDDSNTNTTTVSYCTQFSTYDGKSSKALWKEFSGMYI